MPRRCDRSKPKVRIKENPQYPLRINQLTRGTAATANEKRVEEENKALQDKRDAKAKKQENESS